MIREKWAAMTPDEQRAKVHMLANPGNWMFRKDAGWSVGYWHQDNDPHGACVSTSIEVGPGARIWPGTDYLNDLNACAEFERTLDEDKRFKYEVRLHAINTEHGLGISVWETVHASAAQRCEAFVLTMEGE